MKKILLITSAALLLSTSNLASAADASDNSSDNSNNTTSITKIMEQKSSPYIFVGLGTATSDDFPENSWEDEDFYYQDPTDDTNASFRIGFGYESLLSEKFSLAGELAYNYYGSSDNGTESYDYSSFDLLARGNYYFTPKFRGYIKAGIANERSSTSGFSDYTYETTDSSSSIVPEFGLGIGYFLGKSFAADLGYYVLAGKDSDSDSGSNMPKISGITLAINYYL